MFFTSIFITHGITHISMMGNIKINRGKNELRLICNHSFCNRYFNTIVFLF